MFINKYSQGLSYKIYVPSERYRELLDSIVEIKGIPDFKFERIIPSNGVDLVINLGQEMTGRFNKGITNLKQGNYILRGNQFNYYDSNLPTDTHFLSIKLTNKGLDALTKIPASELINSYVENPFKGYLHENIMRIIDSQSFHHRVNLIRKWIESTTNYNNRNILATTIENKITTNPNYTVHQLEQFSGYTEKYLNKVFKNYSGYTISNFKRLCRFNNTIDTLRYMGNKKWTDILYDHNFYDQSHFINEMKHFTGLNPSQIRKNFANQHFNLIF